MSKPARVVAVVVAIAAAVLEVVAYLMYQDTVDGQAVLLNVAIAVYTLFALGAIAVADHLVRAVARRRRASGP